MSGASRVAAVVVPLALFAVMGASCQPGTFLGGGPDTTEIAVPVGTLDAQGAIAALPTIPIGTGADAPGYDRDCGPGEGCVFGPSWSDDVGVEGGRNGCDTRNDILARDLKAGDVGGQQVPKRLEANNCVVVEGVLDDPFTGERLHFTKRNAGKLQVDHVVALAAAWRAGAAAWDPLRRQDFANDPRNLLLVDGPTNQSKGDGTADEWLPPNAAYHCEYARIVVTVKATYQLTVTTAEQAALHSALGRCAPPTTPVPPAT